MPLALSSFMVSQAVVKRGSTPRPRHSGLMIAYQKIFQMQEYFSGNMTQMFLNYGRILARLEFQRMVLISATNLLGADTGQRRYVSDYLPSKL